MERRDVKSQAQAISRAEAAGPTLFAQTKGLSAPSHFALSVLSRGCN